MLQQQCSIIGMFYGHVFGEDRGGNDQEEVQYRLFMLLLTLPIQILSSKPSLLFRGWNLSTICKHTCPPGRSHILSAFISVSHPIQVTERRYVVCNCGCVHLECRDVPHQNTASSWKGHASHNLGYLYIFMSGASGAGWCCWLFLTPTISRTAITKDKHLWPFLFN